MKKVIHIFRISKFKCFAKGLLFALISIIALGLCLSNIDKQTHSELNILFFFGIAFVSMLMGLVAMFRKNVVTKEKNIVR